jgi:hypothetical protein
MPFFDSRSDYRYCHGCGAELLEDERPGSHFDGRTGERNVRRFLRCPNGGGLFGWIKHPTIEPHYWGAIPPPPVEE